MPAGKYTDLLAGFDMGFNCHMPSLGAAFREGDGDSGYALQEHLGASDLRRLGIWLHRLRAAAASGASLNELNARLAERHERCSSMLSANLARTYEQTRELECTWRSLNAFFVETEPAWEGGSAWVWNGSPEGWVAAMKGVTPMFVVTPGRSVPPKLDPWPGPYPEPIVFGDLALEAAEPLMPPMGDSPAANPEWSTSTPSRFAICVNQLRLRDPYPWEPEPLWGWASPAVAGVHARRYREGEWNSTGAGPRSGRLRSARGVRVRLTVPRCEALREKGTLPLTEDGKGEVAVVGEQTLAAPGRPSVGIATLKMEALASRLVPAQLRRRARQLGGSDGLDPRREADTVLRALLEQRLLHGYEVKSPAGGDARRPIEVALRVDDWTLRTHLAANESPADRVAPMPAPPEPVKAAIPPAPHIDEPRRGGGIDSVLRFLTGWFTRGRREPGDPGLPTAPGAKGP